MFFTSYKPFCLVEYECSLFRFMAQSKELLNYSCSKNWRNMFNRNPKHISVSLYVSYIGMEHLLLRPYNKDVVIESLVSPDSLLLFTFFSKSTCVYEDMVDFMYKDFPKFNFEEDVPYKFVLLIELDQPCSCDEDIPLLLAYKKNVLQFYPPDKLLHFLIKNNSWIETEKNLELLLGQKLENNLYNIYNIVYSRYSRNPLNDWPLNSYAPLDIILVKLY